MDDPYTTVIVAAFRALMESPYAPVFIILIALHLAALYCEPRKDDEIRFFD